MQKLRYSVYAKPLIVLLDLVFMLFIFGYSYLDFYDFDFHTVNAERFSLLVLLFSAYWVLLSARTAIYHIPRTLTYTRYSERLIFHIAAFTIGIILLVKINKTDFLVHQRGLFAGIFLLGFLFIKSLIFLFLKYIRAKGFNIRNVMFLADNESSALLKQRLRRRRDYGFQIFDFPYSGLDVNQLENFWQENGIYNLFMPVDHPYDAATQKKIVDAAERNKIRISLVPSVFNDNFYKYDLDYFETQPILLPSVFPLDYSGNYLLKRLFDIVFSLGFLLFIGVWLFPLVTIIIKLDSKGPAFFIQKRYGCQDGVFSCLKFRTMMLNNYSDTKVTDVNDQRITSVGGILRRYNIDECPQFINVLLGQMSVVGPRPHMLLVDDYYKAKLQKYTLRSRIKPGITGLAQVNGLRGDEGNRLDEMQKRVLADAFYVKNWNLSMDIVIIIKTFILSIMGNNK